MQTKGKLTFIIQVPKDTAHVAIFSLSPPLMQIKLSSYYID